MDFSHVWIKCVFHAADYLGLEGLSFRQAHEIAATVARAVVAKGGGLSDDGYGPFLVAFEDLAGRKPVSR